jgi:hypothetical protein
MQVWVIWLVPVVLLLVVPTTAVLVGRKPPLTHQQAIRELRRARRESHFSSHHDAANTQCPVNPYVIGGGYPGP